MELAKYKACICEGSAENAIMDILLDSDLLIFSREQMLEEEVIRCRDGKRFEEKYLRKGFLDKISVIRILDSRHENFKLSKAYEHKVDVINVITAPEIEMLIIFNEDKYKEFKKSGKKPSDFCKEDLKMTSVKSYSFVKNYFSDPDILLIGVDDDGTVKGLDSKTIKKLLEDIPNKITAAFGITCDVNEKIRNKKKYLQIIVKKSKLPLNLHGRYYYRTGSVKKEITGFELTEFIIKCTGTSFDAMTSDIPREGLSFDAFKKRYIKATRNSLDLDNDLVSFKLMQEDGQMTNAGVLFADQWNIHHSRIFCTRWNGVEKANSTQEALDDDEFTGSLLELFDSSMKFIKKNTKMGWRKEKKQRIELPDYPERALEEGLVNAIIHRSYLQTGAHSQIDIYDDRLVITNPGGMYDGSEVQLLDLRRVPSKLRNPIIADIFGRLRLMERRGSGFKKILDAYETAERYTEDLKPEFYTDGYNFFLTLWNLNYAYDKAQNKAQNKAQCGDLSEREYLLLLLQENPLIKQTELAEIMNKSRRTIQTLMKELTEEGFIERIGSKKTGTWIVIKQK